MNSPLRFSQLSPERQRLVRILQAVNFGELHELQVRDGDAIFDPSPEVLIDMKLDNDQLPRLEADLIDFELHAEICRLIACLDELRNGTIRRLEVRGGIPRRVVIGLRLTESCGETHFDFGAL